MVLTRGAVGSRYIDHRSTVMSILNYFRNRDCLPDARTNQETRPIQEVSCGVSKRCSRVFFEVILYNVGTVLKNEPK